MHPWFKWIIWINPGTYAMNAAVGEEMGSRLMPCVEPQFVPFGPNYTDDAYRSCTLGNTEQGSSLINGASYIESGYGISATETWRDVGIIIALWIFFACMAAVGFELNQHSDSGSTILFDKSGEKRQMAEERDAEKASAIHRAPQEIVTETKDASPTVFTFKDISYFVKHEGKEKQLLQRVSGFVKPGQLVALMGSSGAGKTTLMDVLAQRKDSGRVEGSIMVNGRPQGISFQRMTGYCEQNDVHEPTATLREALLFSARLRQPRETPDAEKVAYVERIMELLELHPLQHAIVGSKFPISHALCLWPCPAI
jgi:ATP-binding cassette subfamily G (WHITE) protein 2 (SNQ2)